MSANPFKRGDRVRCVDPEPCDPLTLGAVYTVESVGERYVRVHGDDGHLGGWRHLRFVLAEPPTLNPFEWDHEGMWSKCGHQGAYGLELVVAWALFMWWVTEVTPTWRYDRTVAVDVPIGRVRHIVKVGRVDAYDEVAVIDACVAALNEVAS